MKEIMNKQEMIDVIYEKIANKKLDFWCKVKENFLNRTLKIIDIYGHWRDRQFELTWDVNMWADCCQIIWHPVMMGDCDNLINKWHNYFDDWIEILDLWILKDKPVEEQSIECITYIYNLCK